MEHLANNLKFLRERDALTLNDMQAACGFPRSTWNGYERGSSFPSIKDFLKIAEYFGVMESDLLHTDLLEDGNLYKAYGNFRKRRTSVTPLSKSYNSYISDANQLIGGAVNTPILPEKLPKSLPNFAENIPLSASNDISFVSENRVGYGAKAPRIITINEHGIDNIVYVPVKAQAGYLIGFADPEFIADLPTFRMPGLNNSTFRMFEVKGVSMSGVLSDRDRVIGEWVPSFDEIRENRVHVIVTAKGVLIKRVLNRVPQRGKIYLKSDTITHRADYPIQEIDPEDIREIWYVNMKVSSDLSEPSEIYQRVSDLEIFKHEVMKKLGMNDKH